MQKKKRTAVHHFAGFTVPEWNVLYPCRNRYKIKRIVFFIHPDRPFVRNYASKGENLAILSASTPEPTLNTMNSALLLKTLNAQADYGFAVPYSYRPRRCIQWEKSGC
jgi:hypothetical protein